MTGPEHDTNRDGTHGQQDSDRDGTNRDDTSSRQDAAGGGTDRFEVDEAFRTIGRTFDEYAAMFDLAPEEPADGRVLDCPSGVGSFVSTARDRGVPVVGADPLYGRSRDDIAATAREDCETTVEQLRGTRDLFAWDWYGDLDGRADHLRRAHRQFLADYPAGPYVAAGLPTLPFDDGAFDLALSANLLFLYDDRLDAAFHAAALRELARVADEVRVFPLASLDTERSAFVEPSVASLRGDGLAVETREVPYEFQRGVTEMLVVER